MDKILRCLLLLISFPLLAQTNYCDLLQAGQTYTTASSVVYASPPAFNGVATDLAMDIYQPTGATAASKRPLMLFIHSGAFISGTRAEMTSACQNAASKGYVTATMSYRLGWQGVNFFFICQNEIDDFNRAALRATQDTRSALQFLYANAETYGIDTNNVILIGYSAGAITALNTAFGSELEIDQDNVGLLSDIGGTMPSPTGIKAVGSLAGALGNPAWMDNNTDISLFSLHGTCDDIVNFNAGPVFECQNFPDIYGDDALQARADSLNMDRAFYTACGGGHVLDNAIIIEALDSLYTFVNKTVFCNEADATAWATSTNPTCSATNTVAPICLTISTTQPKDAFDLRIFPNPTDNLFQLEAPLKTTFALSDALGRMVLNGTTQMPITTLSVSGLPVGVYYLSVQDLAGSKIVKPLFVVR